MDIEIQNWQRRFIDRAFRSEVNVAALSAPRGNGKTTLAGLVAADRFKAVEPHQEVLLVAGSIEQGRSAFRVARRWLGDQDFRWIDSAQRCSATRSDGAKLTVRGANGRGLMGIVGVPLIVCDEPGAWNPQDGQLMADAIFGALGKPESPLRILLIGTLSPAGLPGHWWHDLMRSGGSDRHLVMYQGDPERWDDLREIHRVNPLSRISQGFRRQLRLERDAARSDERLKAQFLSYRLNLPSADSSTVLLTVEEYQTALRRPAALPVGRPVVGVDLGSNRAWSAAVAIWESGRVECLAVAPGEPGLVHQERRDQVPAMTYQRLAEEGSLRLATGRKVPLVSDLTGFILERWGRPARIICDRFRLDELTDEIGNGCQIEPRVSRWSEAAADIRSLRRLVNDGPLSVSGGSDGLLRASLSAAQVKTDDQGSVRLAKKSSSNRARDDVAAAFILAAGAFDRATRSRAGAEFSFRLVG